MKTVATKLVPIIVAVALLAACAGTPFKWSQARKIAPGMTVSEVTQLMGSPTEVIATGDIVSYIWVFANGMTGSSRSLRVDFRNGKAISAPPIPASFKD